MLCTNILRGNSLTANSTSQFLHCIMTENPYVVCASRPETVAFLPFSAEAEELLLSIMDEGDFEGI